MLNHNHLINGAQSSRVRARNSAAEFEKRKQNKLVQKLEGEFVREGERKTWLHTLVRD